MKKNSVIQPEGNYYDKYHSTNFIVRWMMKNYFAALYALLPAPEKEIRILDAGCGEGEVSGQIIEKYQKQCKCMIDAFDVSEKVVCDAQKRYPDIRFSTGDIYNITGEGYELVLCCEVLEHLEYPEKALEQLKHAADKYIILSVPREPVWRCLNMARGKYLKDFGNTPGHIQHWSTRGFLRFLKENGMSVEKIRKPFPWTMVLVKKEQLFEK